jgi:15-cis-phytoene synthase
MKQADIGSSLYYSLLYVDEHTQQSIITFRALFHELSNIVFECREPQVAATKLQWWKNELEQKTSQHPLIVNLLPIDKQCFNKITDAFLHDLHNPLYDKQEKLLDFYRNTAGMVESHLANLYHAQQQTKENLCHFGIFIQLVAQLRDIRLYLRRGRSYLSGELLLQHHATLKELSEFKMTSNIHALFKAQCKLANRYYQIAQKNLTTSERKKIMPTMVLANIHKVLLDEIERADFPVLQQRLGLTPLRKWWISWKTRNISLFLSAKIKS